MSVAILGVCRYRACGNIGGVMYRSVVILGVEVGRYGLSGSVGGWGL